MPTHHLIEPTDVLFFRDGIPMSAGQGQGSGSRLPFPSTLHEALRASLIAKHGRSDQEAAFRPKDAPRKGGWLGKAKSISSHGGSKDYQSLRLTGPLPWIESNDDKNRPAGLLLPVPLDVSLNKDQTTLHRLSLLQQSTASAGAFAPACLPVATTPPDKNGQLHGWWTTERYLRYLAGETDATKNGFVPIPTDHLWSAEHRTGLAIDPATSSAQEGQLFAGNYLRLKDDVRFCIQAQLGNPRDSEQFNLDSLDWLLLGGDRRLARLWAKNEDVFEALRAPLKAPAADGPVLLKWSLITPAIFAHGSLPGWCKDSRKNHPDGLLPDGRVCFNLPGSAALISWCLGRPQTVTGWDTLKNEAKPTQLAVPAGSVYYFLCQDTETATRLAEHLHWRPRSDHYGEKGCGYGLCSFDVSLHPTSPDIRQLAKTLFNA
jgi:CRISPR type III-B/RAMP module-associated protein Cmr3